MKDCRLAALSLSVAVLVGLGTVPVLEARAQVIDEARQAGRTAPSLPPADEDYFHAMDGGIKLSADEVKGRNMWLVWTGETTGCGTS